MKPDETAFEAEIEAWLLDHGYAKGDPRSFDRALGLDPGELLAFVAATQPDAWARLSQLHGGEEAARAGLLKRARGRSSTSAARSTCCATASRTSASTSGSTYFRPAHGLDAGARRRLRREPALGRAPAALRRLDERRSTWRCFVNGIPVATAELKNPLTGQTVEHAIAPVPARTATRRT